MGNDYTTLFQLPEVKGHYLKRKKSEILNMSIKTNYNDYFVTTLDIKKFGDYGIQMQAEVVYCIIVTISSMHNQFCLSYKIDVYILQVVEM